MTGTYRWNGEFADPRLESDYRRARWLSVISRGRSAVLCVLIFVLAALSEYDRYGWSPEFLHYFGVRLSALPVVLLPYLLFANRPDRKFFYLGICISQIYLFFAYLYVTSAAPGGGQAKLLSAFLILAVFYGVFPNRVHLSVIIGGICSVAFLVVGANTLGWPASDIAMVLALFVMANIAGFHFARSDAKRRRMEFANLLRQTELNDQLKREVLTREEAQCAMRDTEESFESIFYAAPLPIMLVDPADYRLLKANNVARELLHLGDPGTAEEAAPVELFADAETRNRIANLAVSGKAARPIEMHFEQAGAMSLWLNMSASLILFQGLPAILIGIQDVTARRKEAEALRQAHDQATAASRSKSEFLANMSHELRTPLNAIIGFSEALERELFGPVGNPRYREYAEDIHDSGVHLLNLINDILDLSKIEAGHFKLHEENCDVSNVVASACRIVRYRAQQSKINIVQVLPSTPLGLWADERALKQILINLVSNAVKFSHNGSEVRVEIKEIENVLRIAVVDKGVGIAVEDIPRALAPFTQLDGTLSRVHEGTGLGLPLAKHLAELHDGTLTIESVPGRGTTVLVDLPASRIVRSGKDASGTA
jgi:signal transduction histidine kinase